MKITINTSVKLWIWYIIFYGILPFAFFHLNWFSAFQNYLILFIYYVVALSVMIYHAFKHKNAIIIAIVVIFALFIFQVMLSGLLQQLN